MIAGGAKFHMTQDGGGHQCQEDGGRHLRLWDSGKSRGILMRFCVIQGRGSRESWECATRKKGTVTPIGLGAAAVE